MLRGAQYLAIWAHGEWADVRPLRDLKNEKLAELLDAIRTWGHETENRPPTTSGPEIRISL